MSTSSVTRNARISEIGSEQVTHLCQVGLMLHCLAGLDHWNTAQIISIQTARLSFLVARLQEHRSPLWKSSKRRRSLPQGVYCGTTLLPKETDFLIAIRTLNAGDKPSMAWEEASPRTVNGKVNTETKQKSAVLYR